jgi:hypothetical protein
MRHKLNFLIIAISRNRIKQRCIGGGKWWFAASDVHCARRH